MKSVVRAGRRVVKCGLVGGTCAFFAIACVQGDPIPADVIQRAEAVLLEGDTDGAPAVAPSGSTSAVPSGSVAPPGVAPLGSASAFPDNVSPPVLPEVDELDEAIDEEAIPEDAIPLDQFLRQ